MTLSDDINRLSCVQLFEGFPLEQLRMLAFGSKRLFLRAGEELYREGALSDGGYLVVSGQIDLVIFKQNREFVLSNQLENSLIGELALITPIKRNASAVARTNCELLHIPRELFKRMLDEYPELAQLIHGRIQISVQQLLKQMERVHVNLEKMPNLTTSEIKQD
ncbi:MAG: cyclic nucleotide-binding domain-containing protein [Salaquimonas sp.]